MTLPELIFVLVALWLFIAIGGFIAARKERKRNLKAINDAHKAEQTILDPHELDLISRSINLRWEDLGLVSGEPPYFDLHPERGEISESKQ